MNAPAPAARIYDIGYEPYTGPRQGRRRACWALYAATLRTAFGIGRGGKAKIIPFTLLGLILIPALVGVGITTLVGDALNPIAYQNYFELTSLLLTLFVTVVAPELLCPDRRQRVLNLYFARPISRLDYAVMKGAALISALLVMCLTPQAVLFIGTTFARDAGLEYVRDNWDVIPKILGAALTLSLFLAAISLAVASATSRRIFAAGGIIALFLISTAVSNAIWEIFETDAARGVMLLSLGDLPFAATTWIFRSGPETGSLEAATALPGALLFAAVLAYTALGLLVITWRYLRWQP